MYSDVSDGELNTNDKRDRVDLRKHHKNSHYYGSNNSRSKLKMVGMNFH